MTTFTMANTLLEEASRFVAARLGLDFPPSRWADLERGLTAAARELGHRDASSCISRLLASAPARHEVETLAAHLTVGETYFFRDPQVFAALEDQVLPDLIERRGEERRLRLWSAGCASGEEPYSLAILLDRLLPRSKDWKVTILASDIHAAALAKARAGIYSEWSFRGTPAWVKAAHFRPRHGGAYELSARIRRMVSFAYLNLAEDPYPALATNTTAMDVVFCRNVLMYFSPERAQRVVENLRRALCEGGWLVVSPSELSSSLFSDFVCFHWNGAMLYRKAEPSAAPAEAASMPASFWAMEANGSGPTSCAPGVDAQRTEPGPGAIGMAPLPPAPPPSAGTADRYQQALALCAAGDYAEAASRLESQLDVLEATDALSAALLARVYANQGKLADALAWCDRALAADKLLPSHHYLRAVILEESGQSAEAREALRRALYLDQGLVMAHFTLSGIAGRMGSARECRRHRRAALSLLQGYGDDDILPESEGITAGRLAEIIAQQGGRA